ncbi:hypothetical protein EV383_1399 [Pseudonocardia sediminis]|uniref:Amine oxidase domain-containing protein n=1 Tax=Pseudonocardia sediminis TaxID=1397368 RepID=A0A4Q7UWK5_PSEST|nr:FAD-dependent oxidoreductase [Pseudonocardia sediminis]RZT84553.1 hypothetical protein EV383_1399 [Pseudonocardia sediminis]
MGVIVVGAGISGVACARELASSGVDVRVLERSHSVGGRLGVHRHDGRPADTGAAYFTVDDDGFGAQVQRWESAGLARPWTERLAVFTGTERDEGKPGPMRWAAPSGLRSLVADLAEGLTIEYRREVAAVGPGPVVDGEKADAVVVAMPDPQARRLLDPGSPAAAAVQGREWNPVLAMVAGYPARVWPDLPAAFVNDHPTLSLLADDGLRRGDGAPVLVAHSTAAVARIHDADPQAAAPEMTAAVAELLDLHEPPDWTHVHRWRFAAPARPREDAFHLGDDGIALAGDGWGKSKVQTAYLSGVQLGRALAERLGRPHR